MPRRREKATQEKMHSDYESYKREMAAKQREDGQPVTPIMSEDEFWYGKQLQIRGHAIGMGVVGEAMKTQFPHIASRRRARRHNDSDGFDVRASITKFKIELQRQLKEERCKAEEEWHKMKADFEKKLEEARRRTNENLEEQVRQQVMEQMAQMQRQYQQPPPYNWQTPYFAGSSSGSQVPYTGYGKGGHPPYIGHPTPMSPRRRTSRRTTASQPAQPQPTVSHQDSLFAYPGNFLFQTTDDLVQGDDYDDDDNDGEEQETHDDVAKD